MARAGILAGRELEEGELPSAIAEIEANLAAGGDVDALFEDDEI